MKLFIVTFGLLLSLMQSVIAKESQLIEFESGTDRVALLEMFSSQGCSSCPPAEKWVNQFSDSDGLWSKHIPVVFHVDYWDYLGWKDPFSDAAFSQRQQAFKNQGLVKSVYTPSFVLNGYEWRGWFKKRLLPKTTGSAGNLKIKIRESSLLASYSKLEPDHVLNLAILGFDLKTRVKRGENRRRMLRQDFVVLKYKKILALEERFYSDLNVPRTNAQRYGIALWITKGDSLVPEQATGNWIAKENLGR